MRVYIDRTPNPNILKFVCDETLTAGSIEFDINKSNQESLLAQELLQFPFVTKIYITANFVAIQKLDGIEWEMVANDLKEIINQHLIDGTILIQEKEELTISDVEIEMTPNPQVLKFIANKKLIDGIAEATSIDETKEFPLAKALFGLETVQEVFVNDHYISVTKLPNSKWDDIKFPIRDFISNYLNSGSEIISSNFQLTNSGNENAIEEKNYSEIEQKIKDILAEYVQPAVAGDGGNIELIEFQEDTKTAKMLLQGACSGCPSSIVTLKNGIENILKQMLPGEVEIVEAING